MAIRYDQKTKDEVVAYVQKYNEEKGRGGQSAAVKKWDLNPITVKAWLEKAGVETPGRGGKKKRKGGATAKAAAVKAPKEPKPSTKSTDGVSATLQRMIAIQGQIAALEAEYAKLKGKL
jgi:hypothetical protein